MDHLPLPKDPTYPFPRVPYVCGRCIAADDFITNQEKQVDQWEVYCPPDTFQGSWLHRAATKLPDGVHAVEAFLQQWIFFGLIRELLGPTELFNEDEYIGTDDTGQYIHTRGLPCTLRRWSVRLDDWSTKQKQSVSDRLYHCVNAAINSLYPLYEMSSDLDLSYEIKVSLLVVMELVLDSASRKLPLASCGSSWQRLGHFKVSDNSIDTHMVQNGWCPSEVSSALNKCTSIAGKLYLQRIRKSKLDLDHSKCSKDECGLVQIEVDDYDPRHLEESCTCASLGPDVAAVAECLEGGSFPLLRITGGDGDDDKLAMEVVPYSDDSPYVAISHVWADGLGNPHASELPRCQLVRLRKLTLGISGCVYSWNDDRGERLETKDLLLWCDSLCCPTIPQQGPTARASELKQTAISKLREVYRSASYTLVLERALESNQSIGMSELEIGLRIITSRWTRRLWTFQEGVLSVKLLIQFADHVVDLRDIWASLKNELDADTTPLFFCQDVLYQIIQLRNWSSTEALPRDYLPQLIEAVRYRRVTERSDEAICIATVLGLDLSLIAGATFEMRMPTMWRLLANTDRGIPPDLIYAPLPRLSVTGYRWAPSTLQQCVSERQFHGVGVREYSKASWTPHGLRVCRKGWRIGLRSPIWGLGGTQDDLSLASVLSLKHTDEDWYSIQIQQHLDLDMDANIGQALKDQDRDWYLIPDYPSDGGLLTRALLVYAEAKADCVVHRSAAIVGLKRMGQRWEMIHRVTDEHASVLKRHILTRAMQARALNDILIEQALGWLPIAIRRALEPLRGWYIRTVTRVVGSRFESLIRKHGLEADASVRAILEQRGTATKPLPGTLAGFIYGNLNGIGAVVLENLDEYHDWCID